MLNYAHSRNRRMGNSFAHAVRTAWAGNLPILQTGNHAKRVLCLLIIVGGWFLPTIADGHDWPMWRYDAGRRAASPEQLPAEMHLQWVR